MAVLVAPSPVPEILGRRARRDALVRVAAGLVLGASLLVIVWWITDGGVQDLRSRADGLTSVGRPTELVASVLLLAQVWLMARVPVLEHAFGQDHLVRIHRLVGFTSFSLMMVHVVLVTWGYAVARRSRSPARPGT